MMDEHDRHDDKMLVEEHSVREMRAGLPASPPVTESTSHIHEGETRTLWGDAWGRLRRNKLALVALIWLTVIVVAAITADLWVPALVGDPTTIDSSTAAATRLMGSSLQHPMGAVAAVVISLMIGLLLGAISGFYGRYIDAIVMRITDIFLAFPYILFCILILAMLPDEVRGIGPVILSIGLLGWPSFARLFRSSVLSVKENDYVDAGRALGASDSRLMFRHIMPNAVAPVVVYATMSVGGAILTEAALSFLGLGIQPPQISWGRMINDGRGYLISNPGLVFWPGIAIVLTVLAFTLLGDGIRDALDVKMKD